MQTSFIINIRWREARSEICTSIQSNSKSDFSNWGGSKAIGDTGSPRTAMYVFARRFSKYESSRANLGYFKRGGARIKDWQNFGMCRGGLHYFVTMCEYTQGSMSREGGGTHMLRHTGMCCPIELVFDQKSLDNSPIFVKKSLEEGPITPKFQKNCKISCSWGRITLKNGFRFAKIKKKNISHFFREKNPWKWARVSDLGPHTPSKKLFKYPPPRINV